MTSQSAENGEAELDNPIWHKRSQSVFYILQFMKLCRNVECLIVQRRMTQNIGVYINTTLERRTEENL